MTALGDFTWGLLCIIAMAGLYTAVTACQWYLRARRSGASRMEAVIMAAKEEEHEDRTWDD